MSNHKHEHCSHNLLYCDKCDVVYCTKCDREWGGHNHWTWYYGGTPYRVTWANTGGETYAIYNGNVKVTDQSIISAYGLSQSHDAIDTTGCVHHI
jgi:hypothetical protein